MTSSRSELRLSIVLTLSAAAFFGVVLSDLSLVASIALVIVTVASGGRAVYGLNRLRTRREEAAKEEAVITWLSVDALQHDIEALRKEAVPPLMLGRAMFPAPMS